MNISICTKVTSVTAADLEGFAHSAAAALRLAPGSWQALAGRTSALRVW